MSLDVFTWSPDYGGSLSEKPRILMAQFGDGYQQRAADGLNPNLGTWTLKFSNRGLTEAQAILDFLREKNGLTAFSYTGPSLSALTVTCAEWAFSPTNYGTYDLSATFTQVLG